MATSGMFIYTGHKQSFPTWCIDPPRVPGVSLTWCLTSRKDCNCEKVLIFGAMILVIGKNLSLNYTHTIICGDI